MFPVLAPVKNMKYVQEEDELKVLRNRNYDKNKKLLKTNSGP